MKAIQSIIFILLVLMGMACDETDPPIPPKTPGSTEHSYDPPVYSWDGTGFRPVEIPVVFHIVGPDRASVESRINGQLDELNRQFNQLASDIPAGYQGKAGNARITFDCAGVTYTPSEKIWTFRPLDIINRLDDVKSNAMGGADPWDPSKYLNVWICTFEKGFLVDENPSGLAYMPRDIQTFPEISPNIDGVVIHEAYFGLNRYDQNRKTLVHEVGHWLDLMHLWGAEYPGYVFHDDGFVDTESVSGPLEGAEDSINCSLRDQNHMDYLSTPCQNIFTPQQVLAMRAQLAPGGYRHSFAPEVGFEGFPKIQSFELAYSGVNSKAIAHTDQESFRFDWKMTARLTYLHELLGYDTYIFPIPRTKRENSIIYDAFLVYTKELGPELVASRWSEQVSETGLILGNLMSGNFLANENSQTTCQFFRITGQDELFNPNYTRVDTIGLSQTSGPFAIDYSCISRIDYLLNGVQEEAYIRPIESTLRYINQGPYYLGAELWTARFGQEIILSNRLSLAERQEIFSILTQPDNQPDYLPVVKAWQELVLGTVASMVEFQDGSQLGVWGVWPIIYEALRDGKCVEVRPSYASGDVYNHNNHPDYPSTRRADIIVYNEPLSGVPCTATFTNLYQYDGWPAEYQTQTTQNQSHTTIEESECH